MESYAMLQKHQDEPEWKKLARWVEAQRKAHAAEKLREDRYQLLEELEFYWSGAVRGWDTRFQELVEPQRKMTLKGH